MLGVYCLTLLDQVFLISQVEAVAGLACINQPAGNCNCRRKRLEAANCTRYAWISNLGGF